jgi:hypothetical protein
VRLPTFYEHHKDNIKFGYRCFDRILLNGLIQPFQQPERVIGFFNAYRDAKRLTRKYLAWISFCKLSVSKKPPNECIKMRTLFAFFAE